MHAEDPFVDALLNRSPYHAATQRRDLYTCHASAQTESSEIEDLHQLAATITKLQNDLKLTQEAIQTEYQAHISRKSDQLSLQFHQQLMIQEQQQSAVHDRLRQAFETRLANETVQIEARIRKEHQAIAKAAIELADVRARAAEDDTARMRATQVDFEATIRQLRFQNARLQRLLKKHNVVVESAIAREGDEARVVEELQAELLKREQDIRSLQSKIQELYREKQMMQFTVGRGHAGDRRAHANGAPNQRGYRMPSMSTATMQPRLTSVASFKSSSMSMTPLGGQSVANSTLKISVTHADKPHTAVSMSVAHHGDSHHHGDDTMSVTSDSSTEVMDAAERLRLLDVIRKQRSELLELRKDLKRSKELVKQQQVTAKTISNGHSIKAVLDRQEAVLKYASVFFNKPLEKEKPLETLDLLKMAIGGKPG